MKSPCTLLIAVFLLACESSHKKELANLPIKKNQQHMNTWLKRPFRNCRSGIRKAHLP